MGLSIYAMMRAIGHPIDLLGYPIKKKKNKKKSEKNLTFS